MSENLIHYSVPGEIERLVRLVRALGPKHDVFESDFLHQVVVGAHNGGTGTTGGSGADLISYNVPTTSSFIVLAIDVKERYSFTDPLIPAAAGDFRSTFDMNPFGAPNTNGANSALRLVLKIADLDQFENTFDIGLINRGLLFIAQGTLRVTIAERGTAPASHDVARFCAVSGFLVPNHIGQTLAPLQTRITTVDMGL